jgi:hypothetical protein
MLKTIVKLPLFHFILVGLGLFILFYVVNDRRPDQQISSIVVVTEDELLNFMQCRSGDADSAKARQEFDAMTERERKLLIDDYVMQEIYSREAEFLGLGKNNFLIKQQMALEFEDRIRAGFERLAGERSGDDRERFIRESMENAAGQIRKTYGIDMRVGGVTSGTAPSGSPSSGR